ncbi:malonate decarboxylase subunit alpha [Mesorhizobium caraganae]|uniref:malonate decarboxylase subunit alpha n=1 Tax=Mesorhizobium caraganae TaxID=483206 RepID=UPI003ECE4077
MNKDLDGRPLRQGQSGLPPTAAKLLRPWSVAATGCAFERDNQNQADFLAARFAEVDPALVRNLHIVRSCMVLAGHHDLFKAGKIELCADHIW